MQPARYTREEVVNAIGNGTMLALPLGNGQYVETEFYALTVDGYAIFISFKRGQEFWVNLNGKG